MDNIYICWETLFLEESFSWIDDGYIANRPLGERSPIKIKNARGVDRHSFDQSAVVEHALLDEVERQRQGGLKTDDAVGGVLELDLLLFPGMRSVVGSDTIDRAVGKSLEQSLAVGLGTQGHCVYFSTVYFVIMALTANSVTDAA